MSVQQCFKVKLYSQVSTNALFENLVANTEWFQNLLHESMGGFRMWGLGVRGQNKGLCPSHHPFKDFYQQINKFLKTKYLFCTMCILNYDQILENHPNHWLYMGAPVAMIIFVLLNVASADIRKLISNNFILYLAIQGFICTMNE